MKKNSKKIPLRRKQHVVDMALGIGFIAIIAILSVAMIVFSIAMAAHDRREVVALSEHGVMDGSQAGANAVTLDELTVNTR